MTTAMNETTRAAAYLDTTLSGDATLAGLIPSGVWRGMAPIDTLPPYVVYANLSATDVVGTAAHRFMTNQLFKVTAFGLASDVATLQSIADRVDALLDKSSGATSDGTIIAVRRTGALFLDEMVDGVMWTQLGGIYRLWVQASS